MDSHVSQFWVLRELNLYWHEQLRFIMCVANLANIDSAQAPPLSAGTGLLSTSLYSPELKLQRAPRAAPPSATWTSIRVAAVSASR